MALIVRTAARAVLLTPENEVLLIRLANDQTAWTGWITPGGGIDEGESHEKALRRELLEELGLKKFMMEGPIWTRRHAFEWASKRFDQLDYFYLACVKKFEPKGAALTEGESSDFKEFRWWKLEDIERSKEQFAPREIASLIRKILNEGPPEQAIEIVESPMASN